MKSYNKSLAITALAMSGLFVGMASSAKAASYSFDQVIDLEKTYRSTYTSQGTNTNHYQYPGQAAQVSTNYYNSISKSLYTDNWFAQQAFSVQAGDSVTMNVFFANDKALKVSGQNTQLNLSAYQYLANWTPNRSTTISNIQVSLLDPVLTGSGFTSPLQNTSVTSQNSNGLYAYAWGTLSTDSSLTFSGYSLSFKVDSLLGGQEGDKGYPGMSVYVSSYYNTNKAEDTTKAWVNLDIVDLPKNVPDVLSSLALFASSLLGLGALRRFFRR